MELSGVSHFLLRTDNIVRQETASSHDHTFRLMATLNVNRHDFQQRISSLGYCCQSVMPSLDSDSAPSFQLTISRVV